MVSKLLITMFCGLALLVAVERSQSTATGQEGRHDEHFDGKIDAIDNNNLLTVTFDMQQLVFTVAADAMIRVDGEYATVADLKPGQFVSIAADVNGENRTAKTIDASQVWYGPGY